MPNFSLQWPGEEVADARKDEIESSKLWERVQYWKSSARKAQPAKGIRVYLTHPPKHNLRNRQKMGNFFFVRSEMKQFSLRKQETEARSWSKK